MPWNDQSGGGRGPQGGGGGPWGQGPQKPQSPWGGQQPPRRPDDKGPDLEEMMRRLQNRMRGGRPGGTGPNPARQFGTSGLLVLGALLVAGWFASGVYVVDEGENGIVTRFGAFERLTGPGLHVHLPSPIEAVVVEKVTQQRSTTIGIRDGQDQPAESLMLTGDEAIVDIDFTVVWQLSDTPQDFVFNTRDPEELVFAVAESAMRETVGQAQLEAIISTDRSNVEIRTRDLMQRVLNSYDAGVRVVRVQLQRASAPEAVVDAFNDVDRARQEAETTINEANAFKNQVVPTARGEAAKRLAEAEGYRESVVREASGEAQRFNSIYEQYRRNPRVIRERLYLETMGRVYGGADKIIIDGRSGVQPYLPLDQLRRPQQKTQAPSGGQQ